MFQISTQPKKPVMKTKLSLLLFALTVILNLKVSATNGQIDEKNSNYVVIGVFSIPKNAIEFTENARKNNLSAEYSINPLRKLFYVFVLHTDDKSLAFEEAKKLREKTPYSDTWVYTGLLGENQVKGNDSNPIAVEKINLVVAQDNVSLTESTKVPNHSSEGDKPGSASTSTASGTLTAQPTETMVPPTDQEDSIRHKATQIEKVEAGSKRMMFKVFTHVDAHDIQGDVDVIDLDKTKPRKVASYPGNESVNVKAVNKSGNVSFVCEVFGYRKITTIANLNDLSATEGIKLEENQAVVPFELVRLKKGDYAVMYNVFFYKDAGIMRPESKYEMNSLLDMMKENPTYKIRIHGHTNGNAHGKVISMGESKNFFAITTDVKEGFGSAKKLSEERAKVIQSYLIKEGIDPTRLKVKAWGGKRPLYEEDHAQAQSNVRVEIEIIEE
jgi:flagellar motor protein MotB